MAVAFQNSLLSRQRIRMPLLRPGKVTFRNVIPQVTYEEIKAIERRALDFLNAFEDVSWEYRADANLVLSEDGERAAYRIGIYSYEGPLAAMGTDYAVKFVKVGCAWIVTAFGSTGSWMSRSQKGIEGPSPHHDRAAENGRRSWP